MLQFQPSYFIYASPQLETAVKMKAWSKPVSGWKLECEQSHTESEVATIH